MYLKIAVWLGLGAYVALSVTDWYLTYQILTAFPAAVEANPLVGAAISTWAVTYGLLVKTTLACVLLLLIFALRHSQPSLAKRALVMTASVYACVGVGSLWKFLR